MKATGNKRVIAVSPVNMDVVLTRITKKKQSKHASTQKEEDKYV